MSLSWNGLTAWFGKVFPQGSAGRKLLTLIAIILLFEGISVIILYSYEGIAVGIFSLALGVLILVLLNPGHVRRAETIRPPPTEAEERTPREDPVGIKAVDAVMRKIDNDYIVMGAGAAVVVLVVIWNLFYSPRPEFGDLDTLSLIFGGLVMFFPLLSTKFKVEATFSLIFIGLVVLFLVVPQAVTYLHKGTGNSVGNWYVHYMLAAPFSGMLNLIGIQSSSSGSLVVLQFHDGTVQALSISAYCAGLYSFSIFLAAFCAFVLVFERLPNKMLAIVLGLGLLIAYLGNLFRMVIIGVVGYFYGLDALLWAHENVGWVIFLSWSAVFWYLLLGYLSKHSSSGKAAKGD